MKLAIADTFREDPGPMTEKEREGYFRSLVTIGRAIEQDDQNRGLREAFEAQSRRSPYGRALNRLVKAIPPEQIVRGGARVVFALDPTPRQRPLGPGAREVLRDLRGEQVAWSQTLFARASKGEGKLRLPEVVNPLAQISPPSESSTYRIVVNRRSMPGTMIIDLEELPEGSLLRV